MSWTTRSYGFIYGLKAFFVSLAGITVTLRLVANWKYSKRLLIDDYISILAIPFLIAVSVLSDLAGNGFHDPNSSSYRIAQLAVCISVFTPLTLWTCKAPILFLYVRLFGIKKWLRTTSYATLAFMAIVNISGIIAIPPACAPRTHDLTEDFIDGCQARTRLINVYLGSVSVLADVVILVLPLPVVFGLKLLVRGRIGLAFLFLSGLFAIMASIISLYFKAVSLKLPTISLALSILATVTECSVALIVGCVPSLRVLWSKVLKPSVLTTTNRDTDPSGNRTNRNNSQYIVVGDGPDANKNALIVSTEVHTSTSTLPLDDYPGGQTAYYHRPGAEQFGGAHQPPQFGVYTEAYALQTRQQGVWGR